MGLCVTIRRDPVVDAFLEDREFGSIPHTVDGCPKETGVRNPIGTNLYRIELISLGLASPPGFPCSTEPTP